MQHNCQLHRISFCADDKTDKRIFTFICKDSESNKHLCYVFDSEKCVSLCRFNKLACFLGYKCEIHESDCWKIRYFDILQLTFHDQLKWKLQLYSHLFSVWASLCFLCASGRRDNFNYRPSLWFGLQEVLGVWRQRRGDQETDWKPAETSASHVQLAELVRSHTHTLDSVYHLADALMFLLINAELVSIDCLKSSSVDN